DAPSVRPTIPPCLISHLVHHAVLPFGDLVASPGVGIAGEVTPGQEHIRGVSHVSVEPRAKSVEYLLATPTDCAQRCSPLAPRSHGAVDRLLLGRGKDVVGPRAGIGA